MLFPPIEKLPYTNIHNLNLDWILQEIQNFRKELEEMEDYGDRITALEQYTTKLENDLTAFKNTYYSFVASQRNTNEALQIQIRDNNNKIASLKTYVLNFESATNSNVRRIDARIDALVRQYGLIQEDIANLRALIAAGDETTLVLAKSYADQLIEEFKQEFPKLYDLYVYSPITGQIVKVYSNYSLAEIGNGITIPMMEYLDRILTVGASGAVYGILLGYGMTFPDNQLFIIPFPFPIKAKWLVIGYVVLELGLGIRGNAADNVAHFAHLGGMLTGFLMILYWRHKERRNRDNHIKFTW